MKKLLALSLALILTLGLAACGQKDEPAPAPALEGMQRLIVMNNAFDGLAMSDQCYNAKEYHKAYSLGELIDNNFWFTPAEDTTVYTVAYTDFYADECDLATFRNKFISFQQDNPEYDYDLFVGRAQKESQDVKYKGYCIVGPEVILLMQEEGWAIPELFEYVKMADASAYDFICADGYSETIGKGDLDKCSIYYTEDGGVNATSIEYPDSGLADIRYIVPSGMTKDSEPAAEGVSKINVALNAEGVYKTEAPYSENRAGVYYSSWAVADLLAKYDIAPCDTVKVISYKDGYSQDENYADFAAKYIAYQGPNEKGDNKDYFTLGRTQAKDAGVTNAGYYIFAEDAFVYVPDGGLTVADAFAATGMVETANYELTHVDGTTETKTAEEVKAMDLTTDLAQIVAVAG